MSTTESRGVGWWFLALVAGATIAFTFAAMAVPV
jgi:hypothetical protein